MDGPLSGHRVLDLTQAIAGPLIGRILADLGADVVKVEWPNGDVTNRFGTATAGLTGVFTHMNAGKRGIGVDLKSPAGVALLRRLADRADVVLENFRPGILDRAGLGYADIAATNPAVVMASVSGFGRTSPESGRAAYAPVIHAESGLLARQAAADGRPVTDYTVSFADEIAALHTSVAVLAALTMRARTGTGQHIDMSMLEALVATDDHASDAIDGVTEPADSRGYAWDAPGGPIVVATQPRHMWRVLSTTHGLQDGTAADADISTKAAARHDAMAAWMQAFPTRQDLLAALDAANLAWADVRDATTLLDSPSLRHGHVVEQVDDHAGGERGVIRMPYRFSAASSAVRGPAPRRGQHDAAVLADWLGASAADVDAMVADGTLQRA
jgi:CoA:oxalate CoA-transferase